MTYGGRWEQLKSGAATHLPFGAGHNRMHTAKAGSGMENCGSPCFFAVKIVNFFLFYDKNEEKTCKFRKNKL